MKGNEYEWWSELKVVVTTSDKYMNEALPIFLYLFRKFWYPS